MLCLEPDHLIPVTSSVTAEDLVEIFRRRVFSVYGAPEIIVTDRGSLFTSQCWKKELSSLGIKHYLATAGHPQTNGVAEHAVQMAKQILKTLENKRQWSSRLWQVEFALSLAEDG